MAALAFDEFGYNVSMSVAQQQWVANLPHWDIFLDLQCPLSKATFEKIEQLKRAFQRQYKISVHITSLPFHSQVSPIYMCVCIPAH